MILFPFHSILGPDCWFGGGGVAKEVYVVIFGVAMLPCLVLGTAVVFLVRRGIEQTRRRKRRHGSTAAGDRAKIVKDRPGELADYFSSVAKDTTRWSVATLYLLYCPTLAINLGSVSFISLDVLWQQRGFGLGLRLFPNVLASDVLSFSIICASMAVVFGLGVPTALWLTIRRLKRRHLLKDSQWQYVFGMLYNDMKPDFWYFEILLFFQKFVFMLATVIPIFVLMGIGFMYTVSLLLTHPFSSAGGYILIKLEFSFLFSLNVILACQVLLRWAAAQNSALYWSWLQVLVPTCVLTAHAVFACLALRAFLISRVYHPLVLKAIAMPEAMSRSERILISWDREHQRINFLGFSRRQRKRLAECILSALDAYVFTRHAKPVFHASFLCVAVDQAIESCKEARTKQLKETHSQMLKQQQRGGCTGLLRFWCPGLASAAPAAAEGIELAKQKRAEKRSLVAALPRVCTPQASIDELLTVFDRQHVKIMKGKEIFFKPWAACTMLRAFGGPLPAAYAGVILVLGCWAACIGQEDCEVDTSDDPTDMLQISAYESSDSSRADCSAEFQAGLCTDGECEDCFLTQIYLKVKLDVGSASFIVPDPSQGPLPNGEMYCKGNNDRDPLAALPPLEFLCFPIALAVAEITTLYWQLCN
eukprot:s70_g13.t2